MIEKIKKLNISNIISRLIAVWLFLTTLNLIKNIKFNNIAYLQNISIFPYTTLFIIFFLIYTFINKYIKKLNTDSTLLLINYFTSSLLWLKEFNDNFFLLLAIRIFFYIIIIYFIKSNNAFLKKIKINDKSYNFFLLLIFIIPFIILVTISVLRYLNFYSPNFDFGIFSHIFYNLKENFLPLSTCEKDILLSHFAVHLSPILYIILPIYYLFAHPITLQVIQAVILFLGIIPLIKICKQYKITNNKTLFFCIIYCFFPIITCGCLYDFHENAFLLPLLLWLFYFFEKNKKIPIYLFVVLTFLVKEDAPIYIMIFALYQIISRKKYKDGFIIISISIIYFLFATYIINTFGLGIMSDRFTNISYNNGIIGAIKTIIINPGFVLSQILTLDKIKYLLTLFLPLAFLPFITKNISKYILLTPILINIITDYPYQYDITFHYNFAITAFLFYLSIQNLSEIKKNTYYIIGISIISCLLIYYCLVIPNLNNNLSDWKKNKDQYIELEKTLKSIPEKKSVSASTFLVPHLTNRKEIYEVYYHENKLDVDYIILDMRYEDNQETIEFYLKNNYELYNTNNLITILKKT